MDTRSLDTDEIAGIYDELLKTYEKEWEHQGHRSLHLGYYDDDHQEPSEAAINTMRTLSEAADIDGSDRILNIGCGAGEDSVWNARAYGATVVGVNVSEQQLELARENAREHGVTESTSFAYDDFHDLDTVEDDSVDVVWGLEALSHSPDRATVLAQAHRTLADGGRVAFTDLFVRRSLSDAETEQVREINGALGIRLGPIDEFEETLADQQFENVEISELTDGIRPCTKRRRRFSRIAHPVGRLLKPFDVVSETQLGAFKASAAIHELIEADALGYYLVTADAA
jgi:cyclopropane fatty-acyl-phospholipid synthase-like methyltransferase